jgi:hypothetical protein
VQNPDLSGLFLVSDKKISPAPIELSGVFFAPNPTVPILSEQLVRAGEG